MHGSCSGKAHWARSRVQALHLCCRDYNIGEEPEAVVREVAMEHDISLPEHFRARHFNPEEDIVHFDLVAVMDKFTAADVLREVSAACSNVCLLSSVISLVVHMSPVTPLTHVSSALSHVFPVTCLLLAFSASFLQ
jgi:hypothetical protein